jgi:hypothetical protein
MKEEKAGSHSNPNSLASFAALLKSKYINSTIPQKSRRN